MEEKFLVGIGMNDMESATFIQKIRYIHSDRNYCEIYMKDGKMKLLRSPIYRMEEWLKGRGFFRIHKSYLVNYLWIDKIVGGNVICGADTLPVSVRKMVEFKRWYRRSSQK